MDKEKENDYLLSSVKNALRILNSFTIESPEKRVTDLAEDLGLGKSTISRLLSTLASEGYVIKDPESQKYKLGLRVLTLNSVLVSELEVTKEARPVLKNLVKETSEAAHIAVLEDKEVVYVEQIECAHPVRILSHVGRRNPAHCTSSGKVLLAFEDAGKVSRLLEEPLKSCTKHTVTDKGELLKQLEMIRKQEFYISESEFLEGVVSFASPIRDYTGKVIATVTLVGPEFRIRREHYSGLSTKVAKAAQEISMKLGYFK